MNVEVGQIVSIEGSDTLWVVQDVDKSTCTLRDERIGVVELEGIPITEITGVLGAEEVA